MYFCHYSLFLTITRAGTLSQRLEAEASWGGEAVLVAAIEGYRYHIDGPVHRAVGMKMDLVRVGTLTGPLLLRYGALRAYRIWYTETLSAFEKLGLAQSRQYGPEGIEAFFVTLDYHSALAVMCGYESDAAAFLSIVGLSDWQGEGFELLWPVVEKIFPFHTPFKNDFHIELRLLIYLTSPDLSAKALSNQVVAAFMPTPHALIEMDRCVAPQ